MGIQDNISLDAKELGLRIKRARENMGLSQEKLAAKVELEQSVISEIENGRRRLAAVELPIFAKILNVPIMYFFGGELTPTDLDTLLLQEFHRLPSDVLQKMAIDMMRLLSDNLETRQGNRFKM